MKRIKECWACGLKFTEKPFWEHYWSQHPEGYQHDPLGKGSHFVDADGVRHPPEPEKQLEVNSGQAQPVQAGRY